MASNDDTASHADPVPGTGSAAPETIRGVFSREGEFWTIAYRGGFFRLRDAKGLAYIAHLLRYPARDFHSLDLVSGTSQEVGAADDDNASARASLPHGGEPLASEGIHVGGLGDAGEMLDEKARKQYRRRLLELREELEEAKRLGRVERAEQAEREIDALTAELSRAVGLGGRSRRAASASERARQSVTRAIKAVIERIHDNNAELGGLLARCIKTGTACAYYPDLAVPVAWEFGAISDQSASTVVLPAQPQTAADAARPGLMVLPPAIPAPSSRSQARFVGREAELARLGNLAEQAMNGKGSVAVLSGGPGVGKTRLTLEVAAQLLQRGFVHLGGRCYERDDPHPLLPFVEIIEAALSQSPSVEDFRRLLDGDASELAQIAPVLRRLYPDLAHAAELPAAQVRRYLFQSFFNFLARVSATKPLLIILDDLHWADESTLALVNFLANRIRQARALVLLTCRDGGLDVNPALTRTLEELLRLGVRATRVPGLQREAVAQMIGGLSRQNPPEELVDLIFEETQGNPFFVEEVFTHLLEEGKLFDSSGNFRSSFEHDELLVPDNVRLVLSRRLARLSDGVSQVLSAASVIGRNFSFMLLESVLDRMESDVLFEALEEAQRIGLIMSSAEGPESPFAFSHELVRQTLLTGLSQPRRKRLHLKIAQAIEHVYGARSADHAAEIAHHLLKSGSSADSNKLSEYLALAGENALRTGAYENARRSFEAALAHQQSDPAARAELYSGLAAAERGSGNWNAALAHLHDSLEAYAGIGDPRMIGRIVFDMVEGLVWTGRFDEASEIAERGLTRLAGEEDVYRARLLAALGLIYSVRGEYAQAMKAFGEALALPAVKPFMARTLAYRSVCDFYFLQLRDALKNSRKSAELSNAKDSPWTHAIALSRVMLSDYHLGDIDEAAKIGAELEPIAHRAGQIAALSYCVSTSAWIEFGRGPDLATLDRRIRKILAINRSARTPLFLSVSLVQASLVRFFAGDFDAGRARAREARAAELPGVFDGLSVAMVLRLAAYSGDRRDVFDLLKETQARLPKPGVPNTIGAWALLMAAVESLATIGERHRTAELYPRVRELLDSEVVCLSFVCRFPQTIAGIAAGAGGQWAAAEEHFRTALQQAERFPHVLEQAEVRRFHAAMLLERDSAGDRERAREMLGAALETYARIVMPRHSDLTRGLLAQAAR